MKIFDIQLPYSWKTKDATFLSNFIIDKGLIVEISLTDVFAKTVNYGADPVELGKVYTEMNSQYIDSLRRAIESREVIKVTTVLQMGILTMSWSPATQGAMLALVNDVVIAPTPEEVTAELSGYTWDGSEWLYTEEEF